MYIGMLAAQRPLMEQEVELWWEPSLHQRALLSLLPEIPFKQYLMAEHFP
jgi:hypothetical protein